MGYHIHFEPGQTEEQKRAILRLAGFVVLDDTNAIVCLSCNSPAVWVRSAKAGEKVPFACSNPACARSQPPAGTGREEG